MKNIAVLSWGLMLFIGCKGEGSSTIVGMEETFKETSKGSVDLTIDGKSYKYDNIDWEKSRIKNEEDFSLSLRQENLPQLKFKFPEVEKSLTAGQGTFEIPDIHRRGFSPITLNFMVAGKDGKREAVTFRKGQFKVRLENNRLKMDFDGEGGPTLDDLISYPIEGTINIKI